MIQPVFTYCGTLGLCWSRSRKSRIESIERRSQKVIGGNYQVQTVESLIKRQSCQLVFDCLQDNVCTPFKGYFTKIEHNINTRNNGCSLKLPNAKLEFGQRSFAFQGSLVYNTLPRHLRNLSSSFLFKSNLNDALLTWRDNGFYDEAGHYLIFQCKLQRWIVKITIAG